MLDMDIPPLYKEPHGISLSKFDDIQDLMPTIPAFFHPFNSQLIVKKKKVAAKKKMKRLSLGLKKQVKLMMR